MNRPGACLLLLAAASAAWAEDGPASVFRAVSPSVVTVTVLGDDGREEGQGSGVAVADQRIVTNCHVIRQARQIKVRQGDTPLDARWLLEDAQRDLCLLEVRGAQLPPVRLRASTDLKPGEAVFAVGNPLGFGIAVSAGVISLRLADGDKTGIIATAPTSPGSSGGGLFDREGRLIGITTRILTIGQNVGVALPAEWIGELAKRGSPPQALAALPAAEPQWVDEAKALQRAEQARTLESHAREWRRAQPTAALAETYLGVALHLQGKDKEAESALRAALKLDERNDFAWLKLAELLHKSGRQAEAEAALTRAQECNPIYAAPYYLRAFWLKDRGELEQARTAVSAALKREPDMAAAWRLLGEIDRRLGQGTQAAKAYRTALRLDAGDQAAQRALAQVLSRSGESEEAKSLLSSAKDRDNAVTWISLGIGERQRGNLVEAERAFRKAIELDPANADAWLDLGVVLADTERLDEAAKAYDRALGLRGNYVVALVNRANLRMRQGKGEDGWRDLRRALAIDPKFANGWRSYAIHKLAARDYRETIVAMRQVVALQADTLEDRLTLAEALEWQGERAAALELLVPAERENPDHLRTLLLLGRLHGNQGEIEKALSYLERAVAVDGTSANAWSSKGFALLRLGRGQEAAATLETAVRLDPKLANAWTNLGQAQLHNRNVGRAIQALEKAIALLPAAADARLYLAQAYLISLQPDKAVEQLESVLKMAADYPPALSVLTLALLMKKEHAQAQAVYQRLFAKDPAGARRLRAQAIAGGLPGGALLPDN